MESRFERVCRIVSLLLVERPSARCSHRRKPPAGSVAMAQVVGGSLFCGFVAGFSAGLAVGAVVSGFACVL